MNINLNKFYENALATWERFPACLCLLLMLTAQLITYIVIEKSPDALTFFLSVGLLLALLLHLWSEETDDCRLACIPDSRKAVTAWTLPFVILAADSYALHLQERVTMSIGIAQSSAILALFIGICYLPFWHENDDRKSWNFVFRIAGSLLVAIFVGLLMWGGLSLLYVGSSELFGFETNFKVVTTLAVLCNVMLMGLLFLIRVPGGEQKQDNQLTKSGFLLGIVRYLFLPLAMLYMGVLYIYGAKIVVTWTLPKGMLSMLVSVLMGGIIAITFMLYPYIKDKSHKGYEIRLIHLMPLLVLPLLVLMSVGIGRRFMDYGMTANRLYLLTLNVWFYVVALGLWMFKARRIHWISISFSLILLLTSCHPWNYNSLYRNTLLARYADIVAKYPLVAKELSEEVLKSRLSSMPEAEARILFNTLSDIKDYDYQMYRDMFGYYSNYYVTYDEYMKGANKSTYAMVYGVKDEDFDIPEGYKHVKNMDERSIALLTDKTIKLQGSVAFACTDSTLAYRSDRFGDFVIRHKGMKDDKTYIIKSTSGNATLVLTYLRIDDENSDHTSMHLTLEGMMFYK